jgi:hypothetical protein
VAGRECRAACASDKDATQEVVPDGDVVDGGFSSTNIFFFSYISVYLKQQGSCKEESGSIFGVVHFPFNFSIYKTAKDPLNRRRV